MAPTRPKADENTEFNIWRKDEITTHHFIVLPSPKKDLKSLALILFNLCFLMWTCLRFNTKCRQNSELSLSPSLVRVLETLLLHCATLEHKLMKLRYLNFFSCSVLSSQGHRSLCNTYDTIESDGLNSSGGSCFVPVFLHEL